MGTETVDGPAAYSRMTGSYPRRMCLAACAGAYYPDGTSDRPGYYESADIARDAVPVSRRHYDRNAPVGAAVYFHGNHVAISGGGDVIRSTDANGIDGMIGTTTIGGIEEQWNDVSFAFWADWFCGHPIATGGYAPAPVEEPTGWSVGQTDFVGSYGLNEIAGARWYVIEPATDNSKTIYAICEEYGVTLEQAAAWSAAVAASKWGGQLLQAGSSWWDGSGTYYAGVCVALNDVVGALTATEAAAIEAQRAAAAQAATQPVLGGKAGWNNADAESAVPSPAPEPTPGEAPTTATSSQRVAPTNEEVAAVVRSARELTGAWEADPEKPPVPDKVALPLWLILGVLSVTAIPALTIPTLDWAHYDIEIANQAGQLIVAWTGSLAALLGLSRFARTGKK